MQILCQDFKGDQWRFQFMIVYTIRQDHLFGAATGLKNKNLLTEHQKKHTCISSLKC